MRIAQMLVAGSMALLVGSAGMASIEDVQGGRRRPSAAPSLQPLTRADNDRSGIWIRRCGCTFDDDRTGNGRSIAVVVENQLFVRSGNRLSVCPAGSFNTPGDNRPVSCGGQRLSLAVGPARDDVGYGQGGYATLTVTRGGASRVYRGIYGCGC